MGLPVPLAAPGWRARTDTLAKSERRVHATGTHNSKDFDVDPANGLKHRTFEQLLGKARRARDGACLDVLSEERGWTRGPHARCRRDAGRGSIMLLRRPGPPKRDLGWRPTPCRQEGSNPCRQRCSALALEGWLPQRQPSLPPCCWSTFGLFTRALEVRWVGRRPTGGKPSCASAIPTKKTSVFTPAGRWAEETCAGRWADTVTES